MTSPDRSVPVGETGGGEREFSGRIAGHALAFEGRALLAAGCCADDVKNDGRVNHYDLHGHAFCECGARSRHLTTNADRKRWHREHKAGVRRG